jgi:DNA polymerase-3 subunit alpha
MQTVVFVDVETTGLPDRRGLSWGQNPQFDDSAKYDSARVVQMCWMVCEAENLTMLRVENHVINSKGRFKIPNSSFHGITDEKSSTGDDFEEVAKKFHEDLLNARAIIAHNVDFDVNVIKAELFRLNLAESIAEMDKKVRICTMSTFKKQVNIKTSRGELKNPTLSELYEFATDEKMTHVHDALHDVTNLHRAVKMLGLSLL